MQAPQLSMQSIQIFPFQSKGLEEDFQTWQEHKHWVLSKIVNEGWIIILMMVLPQSSSVPGAN